VGQADWLMWSVFMFWSLRTFAHFYKAEKKMKDEGREFGVDFSGLFFMLLLPWAIRRAEKEFIREQKDNR